MEIHDARSVASRLLAVTALVGLLAGCQSPTDSVAQPSTASNDQHLTVASVVENVAGARAAALAGDQKSVQAHANRMAKDFLHDAHIPDPTRPIPREAARARIAQVSGVRSVAWIDHNNLLVLVNGGDYRNMAMVDRICATLAPLGDTMGVVVNVQDVTATTSVGADAVSRDCQLPVGQRAFLQDKRQIEALDPAVRAAFEAQQHH